jgi:hypothetical protein
VPVYPEERIEINRGQGRTCMFLTLLNNEEKRAFALLAEKMIAADGIVVGREAATLAAYKGEMGFESPSGGEDQGVEELAAAFESRRSKVVVLLELIGLGYSDTSFSVTERSLVFALARAMDIEADTLVDLESWVQQHVRLIRQAMELLRE